MRSTYCTFSFWDNICYDSKYYGKIEGSPINN